jgi:hypothetical protein
MSIAVPRWRFTESMIQDAPEWKGVYVLWAGERPVLVGRATGGEDTIRSQLLKHYLRNPAPVTHYSWEICPNPARRGAQLAEALDEWTASASS